MPARVPAEEGEGPAPGSGPLVAKAAAGQGREQSLCFHPLPSGVSGRRVALSIQRSEYHLMQNVKKRCRVCARETGWAPKFTPSGGRRWSRVRGGQVSTGCTGGSGHGAQVRLALLAGIAVSCVGVGGSPCRGSRGGGGSEEAGSPRSPWASPEAFPDPLVPRRGVRSSLVAGLQGTPEGGRRPRGSRRCWEDRRLQPPQELDAAQGKGTRFLGGATTPRLVVAACPASRRVGLVSLPQFPRWSCRKGSGLSPPTARRAGDARHLPILTRVLRFFYLYIRDRETQAEGEAGSMQGA